MSLCVLATSAMADVASDVPTNMALMRRVLATTVEKALETWPAGVGTVAVVIPSQTHALGWLGEVVLTEHLIARGVAIHGGDGKKDSIRELECNLGQAQVAYESYSGGWSLGDGSVERSAEASLTLTLNAKSGAAEWIEDTHSRAADVIPASTVPDVAGDPVVHLAPVLPTTNWAPYIEPVIVSGTVGGLIYLFFTR